MTITGHSGAEARVKPVLISRPNQLQRAASLGKAHYSYGFAADNFVRMLQGHGIAVREIESPEQLKNPLFAEQSGLGTDEHLHLIFRSTEDIRTIPGAYNVACFAWEFDRLKDDGLPEESVLDDQVRMLRTCQEVWTPCSYTHRLLLAHGIANAHVIPAPIASPAPLRGAAGLGDLGLMQCTPLVTQSSGDEAAFQRLAQTHATLLESQDRLSKALAAKRVFLTVCNPYDKRKNLATEIEGFLMATRDVDDAVLLVKLVTSGIFEQPAGYLFHQMRVIFGNPHCLHEESIVLFSGFLSNAQMARLYSLADFYVCASIAEGQNLPLLEAMAQGCVPVSVRNTAMADYVDEENAVVIEEGRYSGLISGLASDAARSRLDITFSDRYQIADAVTAALALSVEEREIKAQGARDAVSSGFSDDHVFTAISERLAKTRPGVVPTPAFARKAWWRRAFEGIAAEQD